MPEPRAALAPVMAAVAQRAAGQRAHAPAGQAVTMAQKAAPRAEVEQRRGAASGTVTGLNVETRPVPRESFREALNRALEQATPQPKTEDDAKKLVNEGAVEARGAVHRQVAGEREAAAGPMRDASAHEVDPASQPKPETAALVPEAAGAKPAAVDAAAVAPAPIPEQRLDYSADRAPTDQAMAEAGVTTEQLAQSNEPTFVAVTGERKAAEQQEAAAPAAYRSAETEARDDARNAGAHAINTGLAQMHNARGLAMGQVGGQQGLTRDADAARREELTTWVTNLKDETRKEVTGILDEMDTQVEARFAAGLKQAEAKFESAFSDAKGGVFNWVTKWGDRWRKLIESSLVTGRAAYLAEVSAAVDDVANLVEGKLKEAKDCVADARRQMDEHIAGLDPSLHQIGEEARQSLSAEFDTLEQQVDQRRNALIEKCASQYKASYERMAATEQKLRAENRSVWDKLYDATVGVVKQIIAFKNLLLGVLRKAAGVIGDIIAHPISFLSHLVAAAKQGVTAFVENIGTHLKKGFLEWLFGTLTNAGLELPAKWDLKGIFGLIMQVLGLTWPNIRRIAVEMLGEKMVGRLEMFAEPIKVLISEGPSGLWEWIKERVTALKDAVLAQLQAFLTVDIVKAGVKWIVSLLNPASAFLKACQAIYDIIVFFVERGRQMVTMVESIVDSLAEIARGSIGPAAKRVEQALANAIPVAIGLLASLLGLGDISGTIRKVIESIRKPVALAIRWLITKAVQLVKAAGKALGFGKEDKDKEPNEHDAKVAAGLADLEVESAKYSDDRPAAPSDVLGISQQIKNRHPIFSSLQPVEGEDSWDFVWTASPGGKQKGPKGRKIYCTYIKINNDTGVVYSGRTSGHGDPHKIVKRRDRYHHMTNEGFGDAILDSYSTSRDAIRGREQMMIDVFGCAKAEGGISGNAIRGIRIGHSKARRFVRAAIAKFGGDED